MSLPTRIRPGAKALIVHEGKILMVQERVQRAGKTVVIHDFPGGGIEPGESVHEALHREVWEELGVKVRIERPVGSWDFVLPGEEERVHLLCVGFQCSLIGSPQIDLTHNPAAEDIFAVRWLSKEEILADPLLSGWDDLLKTVQNVV